MRIAIANDDSGQPGGIDTYLQAVIPALVSLGHEIVFVQAQPLRETIPHAFSKIRTISAATVGIDECIKILQHQGTQVCFSNQIGWLDLDEKLADAFPVLKFMHGYTGTCLSGLKMRSFPSPKPCSRTLGLACKFLYVPCRCGPLRPSKIQMHFTDSRRQHELLRSYVAVMVASAHMREEYEKHGVSKMRIVLNPLFAAPLDKRYQAPATRSCNVLFIGRMTKLKGGDYLIRAVQRAQTILGRNLTLVMAGHGPETEPWQRLSQKLSVQAEFPGWVDGDQKQKLFQNADVVAIPSLWPEPFGLTGLEAGLFGTPAIAFDSGGVREWLKPEVNGVLAPGRVPNFKALGDQLARIFSEPNLLASLRTGALRVASEMKIKAHIEKLDEALRKVATEWHPGTY